MFSRCNCNDRSPKCVTIVSSGTLKSILDHSRTQSISRSFCRPIQLTRSAYMLGTPCLSHSHDTSALLTGRWLATWRYQQRGCRLTWLLSCKNKTSAVTKIGRSTLRKSNAHVWVGDLSRSFSLTCAIITISDILYRRKWYSLLLTVWI